MKKERLSIVQEELIAQIAKKSASASELSRKTNTSLPYILSQLKLLEAKNYLTKTTLRKQGAPGKPRQEYALQRNIVHATIVRNNFAKEESFENDKLMQLFLQLYTQIKHHKEAISRYFWDNAKDFAVINAIAKISVDEKKIELLALTSKKNLDNLRKTISSYEIKEDKETIKIACWVHCEEEFDEGIKNKDPYYQDLAKKIVALIDDTGEIKKIKELL